MSLGFFTFFLMLDGPHIAKDSPSYLHMSVFREPVYPLFLALMQRLPGAGLLPVEGYDGLYYAVFFQGVLWSAAFAETAVCTASVSRRILQQENRGETIAMMSGCCAVFFQIVVCLLNRFYAKRAALYASHIMTEALAMPFWLLFTVRLYRLFREEKKSDLVFCFLMSVLMIETRKQLRVMLLLWGWIAFVFLIRKQLPVRRFFLHLALILLAVCTGNLLERTCNYALHGSFVPQAGTSEGMLCTLLYMADEEDASLFGETEEKELAWFREIIAEQRNRGVLMDEVPADAGWRTVADHFSASYDVIGYEIVHPVLTAAAAAEGLSDGDAVNLRMYALEGVLARILLRQNLSDYIRLYTANLLFGLVESVALMRGVLIPAAFLLYLLTALLFAQAKHPETRLFALLVLSGIFINCAVVGALIFPQSRYMIYGMGLFYTALLLLLEDVWMRYRSRQD